MLQEFKLEIDAALASEDLEKIYKITEPFLKNPMFGMMRLNRHVGDAIEDPDNIEKYRHENWKGIKAIGNYINQYLRHLHPELPKPPKCIGSIQNSNFWDKESNLEHWESEWASVLSEVMEMHKDGKVSVDVYNYYYEGWLGVESMIDFADGKDMMFLKSKNVESHPDCILRRNRPNAEPLPRGVCSGWEWEGFAVRKLNEQGQFEFVF